MQKKCELCQFPAKKGERYCHHHRRVMLQKMKDDGYLVEVHRFEHGGDDLNNDDAETRLWRRLLEEHPAQETELQSE